MLTAMLSSILPPDTLQVGVILSRNMLPVCSKAGLCWYIKAQTCTCVLAGIFRDIVVSRKGLYSWPVATGVIFAVNVYTRGTLGAPLDAYSQDLLVSMQARQLTFEPSKHLGA